MTRAIHPADAAEAAEAAAELDRQHPGRRAMVYALLPEGSPIRQVHVPTAMLKLR